MSCRRGGFQTRLPWPSDAETRPSSHIWPQITEAEPTITTIIDLVLDLWDDDVGIPTLPVAISYLQKCLIQREDPDPKSLISMMAPWSVRPYK